MLNLNVLPADGSAEPPASVHPSRITRWRDVDGVVAAWGYVQGSTHHLGIPGVGRFRFSGHEVAATPEPGASDDLLNDAFRRIVIPLALQALGREVVHASAVAAPGGVVALCARSTIGKSTLAYALARRGFPVWADDAVALEREGETFSVLALPFQLRLRPASVTHFGLDDAPSVGPMTPEGGARRLAAVCLLQRGEAGPTEHVKIRRLPPAEAFPAVLDHAYLFCFEGPDRKRRMMRDYLDLTARVPTLLVRFRSGLEHVDPTADAIAGAVKSLTR
jgi:hypothetical protein